MGDLSAIVWEYWTEEEVCLVVKIPAFNALCPTHSVPGSGP